MPNIRSSRLRNVFLEEQFGAKRTLFVKANVARMDGEAMACNFWSSHQLKSITRADSGLGKDASS